MRRAWQLTLTALYNFSLRRGKDVAQSRAKRNPGKTAQEEGSALERATDHGWVSRSFGRLVGWFGRS